LKTIWKVRTPLPGRGGKR